MTKTTASAAISTSLLLLVGGTLYLIQRNNQEAAAYAEPLRASKESIPVSTGDSRVSGTTTQANTASPASPVSPVSPENMAYLNRLETGMRSVDMGGAVMTMIDIDVVNEMDGMHLETLVKLLTEAQTDERYTKTISSILDKIAAKSPADATTLSAEIVIISSPFDKSLSYKFGNYFRDWLETDRAAADRWYFTVMASGELVPKNPPEAGGKIRMPDRIIMQNSFKVMMNAGSEQAISMAEEMTDEEIVYAMDTMPQDFREANTSPGFISRIVRNLPPERQTEALGRYVDFMLQSGFANKATWLDALDIADSAHAAPLSRALITAYNYRRLSKSQAMKINDGWPDSPIRKNTWRKIEGK